MNEHEEWLEKHIGMLDKERLALVKRISTLQKALHEVRSPRKNFHCKLGLSKPMCVGCAIARPKYTYGSSGAARLILPGDRELDFGSDIKDRVCGEWEKKIEPGACGCGGSLKCECGYTGGFCFEPDSKVCPYCASEAEWVATSKPLFLGEQQ